MSGYSSKAEVVQVVKATIRAGSELVPDLPRDPKRFYISRIVADLFAPCTSGGWRVVVPDEVGFWQSVRAHRR